jgi:tripartite-type tricarboxylate transporter receptor subunit TctC
VIRAAVAAAVAVLCALAPARAADFFEGKTIQLYIGSTAGGGYDSYARLIARHWSEHIPGHPTIVPVNMPGAGSNKLAYYIYAVAPKDGTAIGAIFPGAVVEQLIGDKPVQHDASKLTYIGSANSEVLICLARADSGVTTFKDAFTTEIKMAASAEGGSTRDFPLVLNAILGTRFKIVTGYPGSREMMLAIEQGEVAGQCGIGVSSILTAEPDWIPSGKIHVLAQESTRPHPAMAKLGIPLTLDFAKTDDERQILALMYSPYAFGRPYVAPPGVPPDRIAVLRQAFIETLRDPATLEDAGRMRLDVDALPGDEVQAMVAKVFATPPAIVARLKAALAQQP